MNIEQVVKEVTVRGSVQGMDQVASAYNQVSGAADKTALVTDKVTKAQISAEAAVEKLRLKYQDGYRQQQQYADAQAAYARAVEQGMLSQSAAAAELANIQDRLAASTRGQMSAANDNVQATRLTGIEVAQTANHLKTAAVAAYALSPAFRQLVNPAIAASFRAIGPAAVSAGGAAFAALSPVLAFVSRLAIPVTILIETFKAMAAITELGAQRLKELNEIAGNASAAGVTAEAFQRVAKGADDIGVKTDLAAAALKKFNEISTPQLGGSGFDQRLAELVKAGNFAGNAGVAAYRQAVTVEEKYRAAGELITIAIEKGERLAGLDLASKFLPPEMLERLRANGELLRDLQRAADAVKPADIFSQEQIGYAVELKRRLDDAKATIENALKPVQKDLTMLGLNYQESWVNITEAIAKAVTVLNDFYAWVKSIKQMFEDIGSLPFWSKLTALTGKLGLNATPEAMGVIPKGQPGFAADASAGSPARAQLAGWLQDANAVQTAMKNTSALATRVRTDLSKPITSPVAKDVNDAVDAAINTLRRHSAQQEADALAVGLGAGALARYRAEAAQTSAVQANGGKITADQAAQFELLKTRAEAAAVALAKAQVASEIDFSKKTMMLSPDDVQIASQLRKIYGNDVPKALASTEAAQIRVIEAQKLLVDGFKEVGQSVFNAFLSGKNVMDAMIQSLDNLAKKLADKAFDNILSGILSSNPLQAGIGVVQAGASALISLFTGDQKAKRALQEAQAEWAKAGPAFQKFLLTMSGGVAGSLADTFSQMAADVANFTSLAVRAHDYAGAARAETASVTYQIAQSQKFLATWNATLAGLNDGLGPDSPFLKAADTVGQALTKVQDVIANTRTSLNIIYGSSDFGATANLASDADRSKIAAQVGEATIASRAYLLTLLQAAPALSAVQTGLLNLNGTAAGLQGALEQLGMSSQDAAAAIRSGVARAIADLKSQFENELTSRLNIANNQSYLNDATALLKQHERDVADAAALGTDPGRVATLFRAEAQKIVDDAGLIGDAFMAFTTQFPELADVVTQSSAALSSAAEAQAKAQQDAADAIKKTLLATQQYIDQVGKQIRDYLNGLKTGASSTLSAQERLAAAQGQFNQQYALAQSGDRTALGTITQYSQTLLDAAKSFYASSSGYASIYNDVTAKLQSIPDTLTVSQVTAADQIVAAIQESKAATVSKLQDGTTATIAAQYAAAGQTVTALYDANGQIVGVTVAQTGAINATTGAVNATTGAVNTTGASNDNLTAAQNALISAQSSLVNTSNSLASSQVSLQTQMVSLNNTSAQQLALLNTQYSLQPITVDIGGAQTVNNSMLTALNKIVVNTYATAANTAGQGSHRYGTLATGGWITGGVPNRDSVLLADRSTLGMPGEFVVNKAVSQAFRAELPILNATGRWPSTQRETNDNGRYFAGLAQTIIAANAALIAEVRELRAAVYGGAKMTADAAKQTRTPMPGGWKKAG